MTKWNDRLRRKLTDLDWTAAELARRSGIPEQSVYKYMQGRIAQPRGDVLKRLAETIGVSQAWLSYGDTAVLSAAQTTVAEIPSIAPRSISGALSRGAALELIKDSEHTAIVPASINADAFAVMIDDTAMTFAPPGATVVIDPNIVVAPGRYVAAMSYVVGYVVVRRWRATNLTGGGELVADNPDFPVIPLRSEADGFILGRAIKVMFDI